MVEELEHLEVHLDNEVKKLYHVMEGEDGRNYIGGKMIIADIVGAPYSTRFGADLESIEEIRSKRPDNEKTLTEFAGEGLHKSSLNPRDIIGMCIAESFGENKSLRRANGFKILNMAREVNSEGEWGANDFIQINEIYYLTLQFCNWRYASKKERVKE